MSNLFKRGSLVVLWLMVVAFGSKVSAQWARPIVLGFS
jgi:hypothetical protein